MRFLLTVFLFLLLGCAKDILNEKNIRNCFFSEGEKLVIPKRTTINIFWEWGEVLITYDDLFLKKGINPKIVEEAVVKGGSWRDRRPGFCKNEGNLPQRVFLSEKGSLKAECIWKLDKTNHYGNSIVEDYFRIAFLRKMIVDVADDKYYVYYAGDSLRAEPNPSFTHRKLNSVERSRVFSLTKDDAFLKGERYMYAFIFPLNTPVYTVSVWTNENSFYEYEPLRLTDSVLPLESLDYKELREKDF